MNWHPMLFSGPMVQALLADRKTQTRCAEGTFPRDMALDAVRAALWEKVELACRQYLVTVEEVP